MSHAAVVARGWGTPAIVGAESVKIVGDQFTVGDVVVNEGRRHLARRHHRRGRARRDGARGRPSRRPSSTRSCTWADQVRKGKLAVRANADTGEDADQRPRPRRRGHRPVPHRAHVPRSRPSAGRARDDPRPDRGRGRGGARRTRPRAADRLRGDPRGDGRPARHDPPARPAAARVPAVGRGAARQGGQERPDARRSSSS